MAWSKDRTRPSGKENIPAVKDECDLAYDLRSPFFSLASENSKRDGDGRSHDKGSYYSFSTGTSTGMSEQSRNDQPQTVSMMLRSLQAKIETLSQNFKLPDSADGDVSEIQRDLRELLDLSMKQKQEFLDLEKTVKKQTEILQQLESSYKGGQPLRPIATKTESRLSNAIQCQEDLHGTSRHENPSIVYLLCGNNEYRRKLSHFQDAILNDVFIPESVNSGSRVLPGRQDYPQVLLKQGTMDSLMTSDRRRSPAGGLDSTAAAGDFQKMTCPVCNKVFLETQTTDDMLRHINSHYND